MYNSMYEIYSHITNTLLNIINTITIVILPILEILTILVPILIVVAFVTVLERKVLGSLQRRVGPDTVGIYGTLQPFSDALKLLVKETVITQQSNKFLFILSSWIALTSILLTLAVLPLSNGINIIDIELGWLYAISGSSLAIFGILFAGWASNSTYSLLGGLRSCSQLISYELTLSASAIIPLILAGSFSLNKITEIQEGIWLIYPLLPLVILYWISCISELNRTPFDLPEAESELVSGYFTEYSAFVFVAFFLYEYASIVVLSILSSILFLGGPVEILKIDSLKEIQESIILGIKVCILIYTIVWIRGTLPRLRYDQLMRTCWIDFLPILFGLIGLILSINIIIKTT